MKSIVFCGYGSLGFFCLVKLIENHYPIDYVLTHKSLDQNSVDRYCIDNKIPFTYNDVRKNEDLELVKILKKTQTLVSVNYRYIIPSKICDKVQFAMNIHGSLLPKYRGRTPHVWSIINGETHSGVTSHLLTDKVDQGDIILQKKIIIAPEDTGYDLLKKYEQNYPGFLIESLKKLSQSDKLIMQDEDQATYYGKRTPIMGYINFRQDYYEINNFIRAQAFPYPGAYYYLGNGEKIFINKIETISEILEQPIGRIIHINGELLVKCKDEVIKIVDYQIERG